jgi:hypothetical protein
VTEPLWHRELRRASRRTNNLLTGRMQWSLILAAVGAAITAILVVPELAQWWMRVSRYDPTAHSKRSAPGSARGA